VELHDVAAFDQLRAARAREEVAIRPPRIPDADVAEGVDHSFVGQYPVSDDKVVESGLEGRFLRHWAAPLSDVGIRPRPRWLTVRCTPRMTRSCSGQRRFRDGHRATGRARAR